MRIDVVIDRQWRHRYTDRMNNLKYSVLERFGLKDSQADVYLTCLTQTDLTPLKISKLTHIPRSTVYDILLSLAVKGLIELEHTTDNGKQQTFIRCKTPASLQELIYRKKEELTELEADLMQVLPDLSGSYNKTLKSSYFKFLPGIEGMKELYFDPAIKNIDAPEYCWDQLLPPTIATPDEVSRSSTLANKSRKALKNSPKVIIPLTDHTRTLLGERLKKDPNSFRNVNLRTLDISEFKMFTMISIKTDYVSIATATDKEAWGLRLKSAALANSLKSIFQLNWLMATPVTDTDIKGFVLQSKTNKKSKI